MYMEHRSTRINYLLDAITHKQASENYYVLVMVCQIHFG